MEDLKKIQEFFSKPLEEVTKSQMLKKAKKGSYPATLVAIENGKVVAQEKVSTPQEAPAAHSVMSKKYPNANIRLEDSTGKILEENSRLRKHSILIKPAEIKYTESFGTGIKAPGVLHKANEGVFLGAEGAYIIVLPGGTFYVDEDTETAMPIWPLKDQSQALHRALDFTPFAPEFKVWKDWIKRPDVLDEETVEEYNSGIYYDPAKERNAVKEVPKKTFFSILKDLKNLALKLAKDNAKEASQYVKSGKAIDMNPMADIAKVQQDLMGQAQLDEGIKDAINNITKFTGAGSLLTGGGYLLSYLDQLELKYYQWYYGKIKEMADFEIFELLKNKYGIEEQISTWEQKMLMYAFFVFFTIFVVAIGAKLVIKAKDKFVKEEEEGYSKFLKTDDNPEGKTKGLDTKTFNKILMNVIKDLDESKPGLWANIHAKRKRGEKPSHGNSKAHKDAVKAGKRINKEK